jgi:hypothetical protein
VKFADLAANLDQMEATNSRNELVRILSEVYRACSVDELEPITYLIQGRLAPFFEPVEMGLGERLLITAIAAARRPRRHRAAHRDRLAQSATFRGRSAPAPVRHRGRRR